MAVMLKASCPWLLLVVFSRCDEDYRETTGSHSARGPSWHLVSREPRMLNLVLTAENRPAPALGSHPWRGSDTDSQQNVEGHSCLPRQTLSARTSLRVVSKCWRGCFLGLWVGESSLQSSSWEPWVCAAVLTAKLVRLKTKPFPGPHPWPQIRSIVLQALGFSRVELEQKAARMNVGC